MNAPNAALLVVAVLVLRLAYLRWGCAYELLGDEALYWESGRRLDWGYYEKGPILPWSIAIATWLFGTSEWAVRLSAATWSAIAALGVVRLSLRASAGDGPTAFVATALFLLAPAFAANAQLATPDTALIALWVWGCDAALALFPEAGSRADRESTHTANDAAPSAMLRAATWFGIVLGIGTLAKQSMLLLAAGLLWALYRAHGARATRVATRLAPPALLAFCVAVSPLAIWNWQHGWPTVVHTLEHLGVHESSAAAADTERRRPIYDPGWTLSLIAAQVGAFGPPICILMWLGFRTVRAARQRFLVDLALPALFIYLLVSFTKRPEANWPFHAFVSLLIPAATVVVREWPLLAERIRAWLADPRRPRPHAGFLLRRPESLVIAAWHFAILYGVMGQLFIAFLPQMLAGTPDSDLTRRFRGHRARAAAVDALAREVEAETGRRPPVVTSHYMTAGLLAFYLPQRPTVWNAGHALGTRKSSYDYWPDTRVALAMESRGPVILVGAKPERWTRVYADWRVTTVDAERGIHLGKRAGEVRGGE